MEKVGLSDLDLLTAQERWFVGNTPEYFPQKENEWYIPQGVLKGVLTIREAIEKRTTMHYESFMLAMVLGFKDKSLSIGFAEIDGETGQTVNDPKIIGLWDKDKEKVVEVPGRDLTKEAYDKFKELKTDLHLREFSAKKERIGDSLEQKA